MNMEQTKPFNAACPVCGGEAFIWGLARASGHNLEFVPVKSFWQQLTVLLPTRIKARTCDGCGKRFVIFEQRLKRPPIKPQNR